MSDEHEPATDHVLRTILANSNDVQEEWISRRSVYLHYIAHANMNKDEAQQALYQLRKADKIDVNDGRYRVADGMERLKYAGEK